MTARSVIGWAGALVAVAVAPAQAAAPKGDQDLGWTLAAPLTSTTVMHALRTTYSKPTLLVVQSSCEWTTAMAALTLSGSLEYGPEAEPAVDWNTQSVVIVAMGSVPHGYDLNVVDARQNQGTMLVNVHIDYQSYENNFENESPAVVMVVDGQGMNKVQAVYDLDLPTLVHLAAAPICIVPHAALSLRGSDGGPDPTATMLTWGSLKSRYR